MLDHVLDLPLHREEEEREEVDEEDGPKDGDLRRGRVARGGGKGGGAGRGARASKTEKNVMQKATTTPFVDEYQNLNSGTCARAASRRRGAAPGAGRARAG